MVIRRGAGKTGIPPIRTNSQEFLENLKSAALFRLFHPRPI